jgi:hypothetical protein
MDKKKIELPKWSGRSILDESHAEELDSRAAAHEMDKKLPRTQAEEEAYREYQKDHHAKAAAHHLMGMKAAQGSGSMDEARKHGAMYGLHIKALGEDEYGPVPATVKQHVDSPDREPVFKFKAHKGDAFLLRDGDKDREPEHQPKGSSWHAEPSEGKDAQNNVSTLNPSQDTARDANRFDLGKAELEKAWSPTNTQSKVGDYETKRCGSCKRDTIHQKGACRVCKRPEAEQSADEVSKSEVDFDRLNVLYRAIRLAEALLAKGDVVAGNFPQHRPNPNVQGPAAPVTPIDNARDALQQGAMAVTPGQHIKDTINRFLNDVGQKQPLPTAHVGGKWMQALAPANPECGHDQCQRFYDQKLGKQVTVCNGCNGKFVDQV